MKCALTECKKIVVGKKYCSPKHRSKDYVRRLEARSLALEALPISTTEYSPDYAGMGDWKTLAPQITIRRGAPARSVFYRLGCSSPLAESPVLHWFPPRVLVPLGMWRLDPFEEPSVPFEGPYCLALFDADGCFIHCAKRVYIAEPKPTTRWRGGDLPLEVNPTTVASILAASRAELRKK